MTVKVSNNIHDLCGSGEEWLLSPCTGEVVAVFWNGNLKDSKVEHCTNEVTKGVSDAE